MSDEPRTPSSLKRDLLAMPARSVGIAVGFVIGTSLFAPVALATSACIATAIAAVWCTDNALSSRWPRSRRPQWAARALLVAALVLACRIDVGVVAVSASAAMGLGLVSRDRRPRLGTDTTIAVVMGLAAGAASATTLEPRAQLAIGLTANLGAAMSCLVAAFRGGPGRIPVRPVDVAWLYVLGASIAGALALPR